MAVIDTEQSIDLTQFKDLSIHLTTILNEQAAICSDSRKVTDENIAKINRVYSAVLDRIDEIVGPQAYIPPPSEPV